MHLFAHSIPPSVEFLDHYRLPSFIVLPVTAEDHNLITVRPEAILSPLETPEVFGYKRGQSKDLKASFHLEVLNGIPDVAASRDKVLNGCPTIAYETCQ
jgi:hypothetical protein